MKWPHAPVHLFEYGNTFFVTGATNRKQELYRSATALDELQELLFQKAGQYTCELQAWALLSNHYHLVIRAEGENVRRMVARFHSEAANRLNQRDGAAGRQVWFQYWDKTLTFQASWLARLKYTHENAVHHGLVTNARKYRWCSASWFENTASRSFVETVRSFRIDRVNVYDEYACTKAAV
jgi:putative transposase